LVRQSLDGAVRRPGFGDFSHGHQRYSMVGTARTNVALRTTVMIAALVVLLLTALLPGPIGWLAGVGRPTEAVRDSSAGGQTAHGGDGVSGAARQSAGSSPDGEENSTPAADATRVGGDVGTAEPAVAGSSDQGAGDERCRQLRWQLRKLGAAYTRLESWESEPQVFRFHCTLPFDGAADGGQAAYRTFEAASASPEQAMERVLADVRTWQAGRRF
jgi:hypothetical protein